MHQLLSKKRDPFAVKEEQMRATAASSRIPIIDKQLVSDGSFPFGVEVLLKVDRIRSDGVKLRELDDEKVQGLAKSFQVKGQKQAINVRPSGEYFFLVTFGEHRTAAASILAAAGIPIMGLPVGTIRAVIEPSDEYLAAELKLTENAHRNEFMDPNRTGEILTRLLRDKYGMNVDALADALGKPTGWIQERTAVHLKLDPSLKPLIGKPRGLSGANALNLAKIDDHKVQIELANAIIASKRGDNLMQGQHFRGGGGGMEKGWIVPQRKIKVECRCSGPTGCGNVHYRPNIQIVVDDS